MHGSRTELRHAVAVVVAAAVVSLLGAGGTAPARGPASVYPSGPLGRSSGEWAARWWQWALAQPAAVNPLTDTTGELCARGRRGRMWFLAGTTGGDPVTRCTIPRGRWLLFPIVNNFSGATPGDPPEELTEAFHRGQVAGRRRARNASVRIDGRRLRRPRRHLEYSTVFRVVLPADNLLGVNGSCEDTPPLTAGCVISPTVDAGFYVALRPPTPGRHRLEFTGTIPASGPGTSATRIDVTYILTIE